MCNVGEIGRILRTITVKKVSLIVVLSFIFSTGCMDIFNSRKTFILESQEEKIAAKRNKATISLPPQKLKTVSIDTTKGQPIQEYPYSDKYDFMFGNDWDIWEASIQLNHLN